MHSTDVKQTFRVNRRYIMKLLKLLLIATPLVLSAFVLQGCEKGPGEKAGEKVDEVVTDAGNALEDACEDVKEEADAKDKDC